MILGPRTRRAAVVDVGSNTANLAVFQVDDAEGLVRIAEHDEPLRLLRALGPDGALPDAAVAELLHVLHEFLGEAAVFEADTVDVLATSALRDAANRDELVARVEAELGLRLQILDGDAEGRCAARAVLRALPVEDALVADLGGGSLQLVRVVQRRAVECVSLPLGALRLSLRHPLEDPCDHVTLAALRRTIVGALGRVPWIAGARVVVGVGGTLRALGRVDRRARQWALPHGHGYALSADAVESIWELVSRLPPQDRPAVAGLPSHRADLIVPGALVASWLLRQSGAASLHLCDDGVREGWLLRNLAPRTTRAVRDAGLRARFAATAEEVTRADEARAAALSLQDALGFAPDLREPYAAAAWLAALAARRPVGPGMLSALFAEPIAGWWQDELLCAADLLSPVSRGRVGLGHRDGLRVLLEVVAARPRGAVTVELDGVHVQLRDRVHVDVLRRFEAAFGRPLRAERARSERALA